MIPADALLARIYVNADDRWQGRPLYRAIVETAYADEGPTLKRHRARARGRVGRIMKRTCHITVELAPSPAAIAAAAAAAAAAPKRAPRAAKKSTTETTEPAETPTEETESES